MSFHDLIHVYRIKIGTIPVIESHVIVSSEKELSSIFKDPYRYNDSRLKYCE